MNFKITSFLILLLLPFGLLAQLLPPTVTNSVQCGSGFASATVAGAAAGNNYKWYNAATGGTLLQTNGTTYAQSLSTTTTFYVSIYSATLESSRTAVTATVNPLPTSTISPVGTITVCPGTATLLTASSLGAGYTYQWRYNAANITGATNLTYSAVPIGAYTMFITNISTGCQNTSSPAIITSGAPATPVVSAGGPLSFCSFGSVTLSTPTGYFYQWSNGTGAIPGATNNSYSTGTAGSYYVTIANAGGCTAVSAPQTVTILNGFASTIIPSGNTALCQGTSILLQGTPGYGLGYQWYLNNTAIAGATNQNYLTNAVGNYSLTINGSGICPNGNNSAALAITSKPMPQPVINYNTTTGVLSTAVFDNYQWYLNSVPVSGATLRTDSAKILGAYTVYVTLNGCANLSAPTMVSSIVSQVVNLGINNEALENAIHVYPNPSVDKVNIDAPVAVDAIISTLEGKTVMNSVNAKVIEIGSLSSGIYVLKIFDKNGIMIKYEKLFILTK